MLKTVAVVLSLGSPWAFSATPKSVQAGSVVNSWVQGGLRVTDVLFDLAIQGRGFFALKMPSGDFVYTRHGAFFLDKDGFLSHKTLGGRLMVVDGDMANAKDLVAIGQRLTQPESPVKSLRVSLDGTIEAAYADGFVRRLGIVWLATFQNARRLQKTVGEDTLSPTEASGEAWFGRPQTETFGSVYASTLEELEGIYEMSLD